MSRLTAVELAARKERVAAIRACRRCDPCGWLLDVDPAVRCAHRPPAPARDITEPVHQPDLFNTEEPNR